MVHLKKKRTDKSLFFRQRRFCEDKSFSLERERTSFEHFFKSVFVWVVLIQFLQTFLGLKIHPKRGKKRGKNKTKQFLNEILRPKWYLFTEHKHASNAIQKKCIFSQKEYLFCYQPFFPLTTCIKDLNKLSFVMSILCISLFIDDKTVLASKKIFNCRN